MYSHSILPAQSCSPSHKDARNLSGEGLGHLSAAHVGDAVQSQTHEGGVSAGQVVLDGIVNQPDQFTVTVHQHRDEQISLKHRKRGRKKRMLMIMISVLHTH